MDRHEREQLHESIAALIDGSITADQQASLGALLERHAEARRVYLSYFELHADLALEAGHIDGVQWPVSPSQDLAVSGPRDGLSPIARIGTHIGAWGAVAAMLILTAAMWLSMTAQQRRIDRPATVATVTQQVDTRWATDSTKPGADGALAIGTLRLEHGSASVEMISGAKLTLNAPAEVELIDAKQVQLRRGNIAIDVPERAIGFRVLTPTADVIDLGTEFGISVEDDGATEVHVFSGVVAARSLDGAGIIPIITNEAGRVDVHRGEIVSVNFDAKRFGRDTPRVAVRDSDHGKPGVAVAPIKPGARVVFLGDKMTSRETHLLLINQALRHLPDAEAPKLYNAAIGMRLWFDEHEFHTYVERYKPDYAVLEFGADLATWVKPPHTPDEIESAILRLCDRLEKAGVEPIITTSYPLEEDSAEHQPRLDSFNDVMRQIAAERGYRLADVDKTFRADGKSGRGHVLRRVDLPTFSGYRMIAETLLDTWGYRGVDVPQTLDLELLPGVITEWAISHVPSDEPLDAATVATLHPDETWQLITLPRVDKLNKRLADPTHSWTYQDQVRGYATHLPQKRGMNTVAVSHVDSPTDRAAYLNTGAGMQSVWINGEQVYQRGPWKGDYPGADRTEIQLKAGHNSIVVESRNSFFLSITDAVDWPLPR